jgi:hypothetical protein
MQQELKLISESLWRVDVNLPCRERPKEFDI